MSTPKVLVVGISGATWDVIEPLISNGRMPNLARLVEEGAAATLESAKARGDHHYRPQVAWATLATGCTPEHHGVTAYFHEADDLTAPTLWEHFERAGRTVGIVGWPGTWPPPRVRGFVVPSHLARDAQTWPPELEPVKSLDRLNQSGERGLGRRRRAHAARLVARLAWRHRLGPAMVARLAGALGRAVAADDEGRPLVLRGAKLELTAAVFLDLCRRFEPDLAALVTFYPDFAMHRYWRHREPALFGTAEGEHRADLADAIDRAFVATDRVLGRVLARSGTDTIVAVVSEHGMEPEVESPEIGPWYFGIRGDALLRLVGLPDGVAICPVARWVAYRPAGGTRLPPDLAARLRALVVVETGLPLLAVHEHGADEVVVKFSFPPGVPGYAWGRLEGLHVRHEHRTVPFTEIARRRLSRRSAMHARDGVLVLAGPGVRHVAGGRARLVDVAPTLLHAAGLPLPEGLDGVVLDVFEP